MQQHLLKKSSQMHLIYEIECLSSLEAQSFYLSKYFLLKIVFKIEVKRQSYPTTLIGVTLIAEILEERLISFKKLKQISV